MISFIVGLVLGGIIGANFGILLFSLFQAAGRADQAGQDDANNKD